MAAPPLDFLGSYLWMFTTFAVAGVAGFGFMLYRYWWEPPLAREITKCKHSQAVPAFIEDQTGNVDFFMSDKKLPEGVVHFKRRGWFLIPHPPATPPIDELPTEEKVGLFRFRGRKPKKPESIQEQEQRLKVELEKLQSKSKEEIKEDEAVREMVTHTPILRGLGKQVFFGSSTAAGLVNLKVLAHADLRKVRQLVPTMVQKTQLDALATGSRLEGLKMAGKQGMNILVIAIAGAIILGSMGLVVFLILNGGK